MATWDDVRAIATGLPAVEEVTSRGNQQWKVRGVLFAWERPLRRGDVDALSALGSDPPDGPILGVRVADEGVKFALAADEPDVFFTIPHFDGYSAVLVKLDAAPVETVREVITDSWLLRAPKKLAAEYEAHLAGLADGGDSGGRP